MFEKLKSWVRRYFGFSRTETNGFMVLVVLFPVVLFLPAFLKIVIKQNTHDTSLNTEQLDSLVTLMEEKIVAAKKVDAKNKETGKIKLTRFNPNTVKYEELLDMGLEAKIATRIINYRQKGGSFVVKHDLKKIYGLNDDEFNRLKHYIDLPDKIQFRSARQRTDKGTGDFRNNVPNYKFDINQADTAQLMSVKGIGSVLSMRIIKFRNKLGGFITMDQLDEVYGLSVEVLKLIDERGYVSDNFRPERININKGTAAQISGHPYITRKLANQVVKYRDQHGRFEDLEQLLNIHLISRSDYERLKPYLTL